MLEDRSSRAHETADGLETLAEQGAPQPASLESILRIEEPSFFDGDHYAVYQRMRREAPAYWYAPRRSWILTRHADVRFASANPSTFSSRHGMFLHDIKQGRDNCAVEELFDQPGAGEVVTFGLSDPPEHTELRRITGPAFTPKAVKHLSAAADRFSEELLASVPRGEPFDFVAEIGCKLPTMLTCELLGLPRDNDEQLRAWADGLERVASTDLPPEQLQATVAEFGEFRAYLATIFEAKRRDPDDGLISTMVTAMLRDTPINEGTLMSATMMLIAGGNHTMRSLLSGIVATMLEFPEQYDLVRTEPERASGVVEEVLRYVTPSRGHLRTAVADADLPSGQHVTAGEYLYLAYDAANRDPDAFPDPERFDITRGESTRQVAFGFGPHVCLAAPMVRMAAGVFVGKLLDWVGAAEPAGPPVKAETVLRSGWRELPVVFHPHG